MNKFIQFDDKLLNIDKTVSFHLDEYSDGSSYFIVASLSTYIDDQLQWHFDKKKDRDIAWRVICLLLDFPCPDNFLT